MLTWLSKMTSAKSAASLPALQPSKPAYNPLKNDALPIAKSFIPPSLFASFNWQPSFFVMAADPGHAYIKQRIIVSGAIPASKQEAIQNQVASLVQRTQGLSAYHERYIDLVLASPGFTIVVFADAEAYTPNSPTGLKGFYMPALNLLGINQDYLKYESANTHYVSGYLLAEEFFHALVCLGNTAYDPISASKEDTNAPKNCAVPYKTAAERQQLHGILRGSFQILKHYETLLQKDAASLSSDALAQLKTYQTAIEHYVPRVRSAGIVTTTDAKSRQEILQQLAQRTYQDKNYIATDTGQKIYYFDQVEVANAVLARGYLVADPTNKAEAFVEDALFDNFRIMANPLHLAADEHWLVESHAAISTNHPRILELFYPGLMAYNSKIINKIQHNAEETIDVIYEEDFRPPAYD